MAILLNLVKSLSILLSSLSTLGSNGIGTRRATFTWYGVAFSLILMVAGLRFKDKGAETGSRVTTTGVNQDREEAAGKNRTEEMVTGVDDEGEIRREEMITSVDDEGVIRTEERKEICVGATLMATHAYTRNPESPLGKEIDLQQWDTLIFKGEHAENEHWRLVEDRNGQVGYAPAAFLMVILDTTAEEEKISATKKGLENSADENQIGGWVGQEGERRKSYSAAVIDGIKRNSRIYVGDSIVRKTDTRLSKEEDVAVCLQGARIEHVTERVEKIMGRGKGGPYWYTSGRITRIRKGRQL